MSVTQNSINNLLATSALTGYVLAANFPALTGDVATTAGSLATTIQAAAVTTSKINNNAVTYAKMQASSASVLLGNPTGSSAAPSEITLGTNLSFTGSVLNASGTTYYTWAVQSGTSATMATGNGYIPNNAGLVTYTLPATAAVGDHYKVAGLGAGGWAIAQNASQVIHFGNAATTSGTGGSVASVNQYDSIELVCAVANTTFLVVASQGNMTVA